MSQVSTNAAADSAYPASRNAYYALALLVLALTMSFVDRQILSLMVQPVRASLGLSDTQISLLHGFAFAIFYTLLGVPLGRWADRHSRKWLIVSGIVLWSAATIACGFANSFWELFVARIFVGVGEATLGPAAYSLIADMFPPARRGRATAVYSLGIVGGSGMALLGGGQAIAYTAGSEATMILGMGPLLPWQAAFVLVGLPGFLVAALMLTIREPSRKEQGKQGGSLRDAWSFLRARAGLVARICFGTGLGGSVVGFGIGAWLPALFERLHGWTAPQVAFAMASILLTAGVAGAIVGGTLADRMIARGERDGLLRVATLGVLCLAPVTPIVALGPNPAVVLTAFAWVTFFLGFPSALAAPALQAMTPNGLRGQMTAVYLFVVNMVGFALGPVMVAMTTDLIFDDDMAIGKSLAIVTTICSVVGLLLLRSARHAYRENLIIFEKGE